MKKNIFKVISILLFSAIMILGISSQVKADGIDDVISGGKEFINSGTNGVSIDESKLKSTSDSVYNILLITSFIVAAIIGVILGIKYMMAGVEEKADVKNALMIYVIGSVVAFGAFGIWKVIVSFLNWVNT